MHPVRLLFGRVPQLLVEFGQVPRPGDPAPGLSLAGRQPRRDDRGTARHARRPVPALSLPHDHELRQRLSQRVEPRQGDRGDQEDAGRAAALTMALGEGDKAEGGCLCGEIRYVAHGPAMFVSQCCCKDCQKATGTGHTTIVGLRRNQLDLTGTPKTFTNAGETGGQVSRHFCGTCGGRLYTTGDLPGDQVLILQAGSLDDPGIVSPQSVIYTKDAVAWDVFDPDLPKFEAMQ